MKSPDVSELSPHKLLFARLGICLLIISALICSGLPSPLYPIYQRDYELTNLWVNVLFSAYAVGVLLTMLLIIFYGDQFKDRRHLLTAGAGFILISAVTMAMATSPLALVCGRLISGIATGVILGSASAALLELHPSHDARSTATLSTINFTLGSAVGPLISGLFIHLNLHPAFTSFIPIIILTLVALPLALLAPLPTERSMAPKTADPVPSLQVSPFRSLPFLIAMLTLVTGWSVGSVFMSAGQFFTRDLAGVHSALIAASLLTSFQIIAGVGQLLSNHLSQQKAIAGGMLLCVGGQSMMCLCALYGQTIAYEISSIAAGLGYGIAFVGATGLVNRTAPADKRAGYISAYYMVGYIAGNALPAVIVGALTDGFGLRVAICLLTIWLIFFVCVILFVLRKYLIYCRSCDA